MPNLEKKQMIVQEIKEKLNNAVSVILINARGINVEQDSSLRNKLREADIFYKVYKNTMLSFAIKSTQFESLTEFLAGPTTIAISYKDATQAVRLINQEKLESIEFKAGVIDGKFYDQAGLKLIADIPSREELISKLLGSLKSPLAGFARVIKAIAEQKAS